MIVRSHHVQLFRLPLAFEICVIFCFRPLPMLLLCLEQTFSTTYPPTREVFFSSSIRPGLPSQLVPSTGRRLQWSVQSPPLHIGVSRAVSGTPGTESMRKDVGAMLWAKGLTPQGRGAHRQMGRARICSGLDSQGRWWQSPKRWNGQQQGHNITSRGTVERRVAMAQSRPVTAKDRDIDLDPEGGV